MDPDDINHPTKAYDIPYALAVECETSMRQKLDFWRLRTLAIILRQAPKQIKNFEERYKNPLN